MLNVELMNSTYFLTKEISQVPGECLVCCEAITNNSVLFHCECIVALCQICATRQVAAQKSSYTEGLLCPYCRKPSLNIHGIEKIKEEEKVLIGEALGFLKLRPNRTQENIKKATIMMVQQGLTGYLTIEDLQSLDMNCPEYFPVLCLELARLECLRKLQMRRHNSISVSADRQWRDLGSDNKLPLGPLIHIQFTRNIILERSLATIRLTPPVSQMHRGVQTRKSALVVTGFEESERRRTNVKLNTERQVGADNSVNQPPNASQHLKCKKRKSDGHGWGHPNHCKDLATKTPSEISAVGELETGYSIGNCVNNDLCQGTNNPDIIEVHLNTSSSPHANKVSEVFGSKCGQNQQQPLDHSSGLVEILRVASDSDTEETATSHSLALTTTSNNENTEITHKARLQDSHVTDVVSEMEKISDIIIVWMIKTVEQLPILVNKVRLGTEAPTALVAIALDQSNTVDWYSSNHAAKAAELVRRLTLLAQHVAEIDAIITEVFIHALEDLSLSNAYHESIGNLDAENERPMKEMFYCCQLRGLMAQLHSLGLYHHLLISSIKIFDWCIHTADSLATANATGSISSQQYLFTLLMAASELERNSQIALRKSGLDALGGNGARKHFADDSTADYVSTKQMEIYEGLIFDVMQYWRQKLIRLIRLQQTFQSRNIYPTSVIDTAEHFYDLVDANEDNIKARQCNGILRSPLAPHGRSIM